MHFTVYDTATGEVLARNTARHQFQRDATAGAGQATLDDHAPEGTYVDLATLTYVPRPSLPPLSNPYDLMALPAGTIVTVTDESGSQTEITDLSEPLTLLGPETYVIKVDPPFPHVPIHESLEVT